MANQEEANKKTVYLHVGHAKTGTSALQTFFARHTEELSQAGIYYPPLVDLTDAIKGKATGGNGTPLGSVLAKDIEETSIFKRKKAVRETVGDFVARNLAVFQRNEPHVLISSEFLQAFDSNRLKEFALELQNLGFATHIVFFARNYSELLFSSWQQGIKRGRFTGDFRQFIETAEDTMGAAMEEILAAQRLGLTFDVFNYDDAKRDICSFFLEKVLNLPPGNWPTVSPLRVNRSLTERESQFLRMINGVFDHATYPLIADRLIEASPELEFSHGPSPEDIAIVNQKFAKQTALINQQIKGSPLTEPTAEQDNQEDETQTLMRIMAVFFRYVENENSSDFPGLNPAGTKHARLSRKELEERLEAETRQTSMLETELANLRRHPLKKLYHRVVKRL